MNLGSIRENINLEKRISITPDIVKKYLDLKLNVFLETNYGHHVGIQDKDYEDVGVKILQSKEDVIKKSNIILQVNFPDENLFQYLNENSSLIGLFDTVKNKNVINKITKKKVNIFSLELLPRITRAQSMDVLSSQANLAGYRAVIETISEFSKVVPMMMTAAGTIPAAKILIIGAGVAGLQAIATAKRLGGIVSATDVRSAAKEQVESLGGKFLTVNSNENLEGEGGYAKEASEAFKIKQKELLKISVTKSDIVICTALIPGKKAPRIVTEDMVEVMKSGSIIYDLAVSQGGNCAYSEPDKIVDKNGVKIMGARNILNKIPVTASNLYSKNLFSFVNNLLHKDKDEININRKDEIILKTLLDKEI